MQISPVLHRVNNNKLQNKSNVNFQAKFQVSDAFIDEISEELAIFNKIAQAKGKSIEQESAQFRSYIYQNLSNLGANVERLEPKNMTVTLDLSDEYKEYKKTKNSVIDFETGHDAGYYKMCELRFGTDEQQNALRKVNGRAVFDFPWSNLNTHMEKLYYVIVDRINFLLSMK